RGWGWGCGPGPNPRPPSLGGKGEKNRPSMMEPKLRRVHQHPDRFFHKVRGRLGVRGQIFLEAPRFLRTRRPRQFREEQALDALLPRVLRRRDDVGEVALAGSDDLA